MQLALQPVGFFPSVHISAGRVRLTDDLFQSICIQHIRRQAEEHIMKAVIVFIEHAIEQGFLFPLLIQVSMPVSFACSMSRF